MIGLSTSHKIVSVKKVNSLQRSGSENRSDSPNIKFIDICCYLAGGTLASFSQDSGDNNNTRTKVRDTQLDVW